MAVALPGDVSFQASDRVVEQGCIGVGAFLVVLAQLGLLTLVLRQFQIESGAFLRLALLAFAGFAIHAFLPLRYRLPFFLALSLAGIALVLGILQWLPALWSEAIWPIVGSMFMFRLIVYLYDLRSTRAHPCPAPGKAGDR